MAAVHRVVVEPQHRKPALVRSRILKGLRRTESERGGEQKCGDHVGAGF